MNGWNINTKGLEKKMGCRYNENKLNELNRKLREAVYEELYRRDGYTLMF